MSTRSTCSGESAKRLTADTLIGIDRTDSPSALVRGLRHAAGLSQRDLARRRPPLLGHEPAPGGGVRTAGANHRRRDPGSARRRARRASPRPHPPGAPAGPAPLHPPASPRAGADVTELDPEKLLRTLVAHEVEFCVIGAGAAWLQGTPSVTLDLDVMPRRELDTADRLAAALRALCARRRGDEAAVDLEGADFLGWQSQSFDPDAGPVDVVPRAAESAGCAEGGTGEPATG